MENNELRDLKSWTWKSLSREDVPFEFLWYVQEVILPQVEFGGYKLDSKQEIAVKAIHCLVLTRLNKQCVADLRTLKIPGVRLRVGVWDALEKAGLLDKCVGSEQSKRLTRYFASKKLWKLICNLPQKHWLTKETIVRHGLAKTPTAKTLICVRKGKRDLDGRKQLQEDWKQPISCPELFAGHPAIDHRKDAKTHFAWVSKTLGWFGFADDPRRRRLTTEEKETVYSQYEDRIERINENNFYFGWMAFSTVEGKRRAYQPRVGIRWIHSGWFGRAARFFTSGPCGAQTSPRRNARI